MGVLSCGAPAPPPKSQIGISWPSQPRMGSEDAAPMLAKLNIERLGLSSDTFLYEGAKMLRCRTHHMIVAHEDATVLGFDLSNERVRPIEIRCTDRLLDQDGAWAFV